MRRAISGGTGVVVGLILVLFASRAQAVIMRLVPLQVLLNQSTYVCTAKVEKVDPERPAVVLTVDGDLKGKMPVRRLPINLKGDSEAQKLNHTPQLLKRLGKDLPLVLFLLYKDNRYVAFGYTNGTWFQFVGEKDGDAVRWSLTHAEPYLRRTFKGTTEEMRQTVVDGLSGKKKPPEPNEKEKPGFGPEVKSSSNASGGLSSRRVYPGVFRAAGLIPVDDGEDKPRRSRAAGGGPLFAVIPTVVIGGPLAFLAMLFPAVFGGLFLLLRRWAALLTVVSTNSTLLLLHLWLDDKIASFWWGSRWALWLTMTMVTLVGALWAWSRQLASLQPAPENKDSPPPPQTPTRFEQWTLWILSLIGVGAVIWTQPSFLDPTLLSPSMRLLIVLCAGIWVGTLYALYLLFRARRSSTNRPALPTEGVILWTMVLGCAFLATGNKSTAALNVTQPGQRGARFASEVWTFQKGDNFDVASSPTIAGDRVFIGTIQGNFAFGDTSGVLYCLDRKTGKEVWSFDNDKKMKQMFSTPCVAHDRVFIGEGFHENAGCLLYCLDAATGKKIWAFATNSHTESSPVVADGRLFFGAGDDGMYCLDAKADEPKKLWQYPDPKDIKNGLHIDANPTVVGSRVYCCSGVSRTFRKLQVFCLDAKTGKKIWARDDIDLPAWGSPTVVDGRVYVGLGNGRLTYSDATQPRGAILCLDAETGKRLWYYDEVKDAIHARATVDQHHVYVSSRDGHCYCLDRRLGKLVWKRDLGSPAVSSPALAQCTHCGASTSLYVAAIRGQFYCLNPNTGEVYWEFKELTKFPTQLLSSPTVEVARTEDGERRRIYFAAGVAQTTAVVYCLEDLWQEGKETK